MPGKTKAEIQEELKDIRDLTQSAETLDELRQLVKSTQAIARDALRKVTDDDDDGIDADGDGKDEDSDSDTDGIDADGDGRDADYDDDDDDYDADGDGRDQDRDTKPAGRRMTKSISGAIHESNVDIADLDASPIIEAVSEGLLENNKQGFQNFDMLKSIQSTLKGLAKSVNDLSDKVDGIEDEVALQRPMVKSAASFVEGFRRKPAGTPTAQDGVAVSQSGIMSKALDGADIEPEEPKTLRGLTEKQLIKGLSARLGNNEADHHGLDESHLMQIGEVPMSELNKAIPIVAAEELGLTLTD